MGAFQHLPITSSVFLSAGLALSVLGCHIDTSSERKQINDSITAQDTITGEGYAFHLTESQTTINNIVEAPPAIEETPNINNKDHKADINLGASGIPQTSIQSSEPTKLDVQNDIIHAPESTEGKPLLDASNSGAGTAESAGIPTGNPPPNTYIPINILFGKPKVTGYLDMRIVRAIFMHHKAELRSCYAKQSTGTQTADITIKITINEPGNVSKLTITGTALKNRTKECLYNAIYHWQFPASKNGDLTYVVYPVSFSWLTE